MVRLRDPFPTLELATPHGLSSRYHAAPVVPSADWCDDSGQAITPVTPVSPIVFEELLPLDEVMPPEPGARKTWMNPGEIIFLAILMAGFAAGFCIGTDPLRVEQVVRQPR